MGKFVGVLCLWLICLVPSGVWAGPMAELCTAVNRGDRLELLDKPLTAELLSECRRSGLRVLRNTIFARHGYKFSTPAMRGHFAKFEWYKADPGKTKILKAGGGLSAVERANVKMIKDREKKMDRATSHTHRLKGKRLVNEFASSENTYHLCPDGSARVKFEISEMLDHRRLGRYRVIGSRLIFTWFEERGQKGVGGPTHCASTCEYAKYEDYFKEINAEEVVDFVDILDTDEEHMWQVKGAAQGCRGGP